MHLLISILLLLLIGCSCEKPTSSTNDNPEEPLGLLWEYPYTFISFGPDMAPEPVGDSLVIFTGDHNITCLYSETGEIKWTTRISEIVASSIRKLIFDDSQVYGWQVELGYRGIFALDINTGIKNWEYIASDRDRFGFYQSVCNNTFFISAYNDTISWYLSIQKDGMINYQQKIKHTAWSISCINDNDKVYTGHAWFSGPYSVGKITCFNSADGELLWEYQTWKGGFFKVLSIIEDGVLYNGTVFGSQNMVVALNAETGEEVWKTKVYSCYKMIMVGDTLFCTSSSTVYALDKRDGNLLWETRVFNPDETSPIAYWDGYVYHPHYGTLYILDGATGEIVHKMRGPDKLPVYQVSSGAGKIFVQSSRHLYAFTPYDPEKDPD